MHPAFSVIFLTTLIGVGQGLFLAMFTVESHVAFGFLPAQSHAFYAYGSLLSLMFLAAGLVASFWHLGRPERAWRAATRWRTSWLSREVIVLPAFMGVVFIYGAAHMFSYSPVVGALPGDVPVTLTDVVGSIGTILAFTLFVCTGMIYACVRFLREWSSPLTVINYILLGWSSGFTFATLYAAYVAPHLVPFMAGWAVILTLLAFVGRSASLIRNARLKPKSTLQTAIGIKHPRIVQKTQGSMGGSYNTREYFHGAKPVVLRSLKWFFLVAVFVVPVALLSAGIGGRTIDILLAAFVVQYVGLLAERWFFFAQANHPQNLYYQSVA
ncbi:MAG: dimethyl sulfoxide reductase anchor subunit family protein [Thiohalomonadaceae bacterium]